MEAHGRRVARVDERRRQHVLTGVLLDVVETPRPVDLAGDDLAGFERGREHVHDRAVLLAIDDIENRHAAERPEVERLAAGGRVERRAIEDGVSTGRRAAIPDSITVPENEVRRVW